MELVSRSLEINLPPTSGASLLKISISFFCKFSGHNITYICFVVLTVYKIQSFYSIFRACQFLLLQSLWGYGIPSSAITYSTYTIPGVFFFFFSDIIYFESNRISFRRDDYVVKVLFKTWPQDHPALRLHICLPDTPFFKYCSSWALLLSKLSISWLFCSISSE